MQTGDFVTTKSGQQWTVGFFTRDNIVGGKPGCYLWLLRAVETKDGPEIVHDLVHEDVITLHSEYEIDPGDVIPIGHDMLSVGKRGVGGLNPMLISMQDEHGKYRALWTWQVALAALRGMENPLHFRSAPMRQALPEEV